jgi:hypothetical protein
MKLIQQIESGTVDYISSEKEDCAVHCNFKRVGSSTSRLFPEIPSLLQNLFQKPRLSFTLYSAEAV